MSRPSSQGQERQTKRCERCERCLAQEQPSTQCSAALTSPPRQSSPQLPNSSSAPTLLDLLPLPQARVAWWRRPRKNGRVWQGSPRTLGSLRLFRLPRRCTAWQPPPDPRLFPSPDPRSQVRNMAASSSILDMQSPMVVCHECLATGHSHGRSIIHGFAAAATLSC